MDIRHIFSKPPIAPRADEALARGSMRAFRGTPDFVVALFGRIQFGSNRSEQAAGLRT